MIRGGCPGCIQSDLQARPSGMVSKRKESRYHSGRSPDCINSKNPNAPAVKWDEEVDWGKWKN
jgi:hypothetical protein